MTKLPVLAIAILAVAALLAAAPAHAASAPPVPAPFLCSANSSPAAPAVGAPAPHPAFIINLNCGVCSDFRCNGKRAGDKCGAGPDFQGYYCLNSPPVCSYDGLQTCNCEIA